MALLTTLEIRTQMIGVIGLTNVVKLEAAGLMPTTQEEQWVPSADGIVTDGSTRTMTWRRQLRLVTPWRQA